MSNLVKRNTERFQKERRAFYLDFFFPFYFPCLIDTHRQVSKRQLNRVKAHGRTLAGDNDLGNFSI